MKENEFQLKKLKLKTGEVTAEWELHEVTETGLSVRSLKQSSTDSPHEDLTKSVRDLSEYINDVFVVKDPEKVMATGLALSGTDDNEAVTLIGMYATEAGYGVPLVTHRIKFSDALYGNEEELKKCVEKVKREVYLYLYMNKKAQLSMLFDEKD